MCLALYIASEDPLQLIPWDASRPSFYIKELSQNEEIVKTHLNRPFVYYAGSYEGCGCAFNYGREYPEYEDDPEELKAARESFSQLCQYIKNALIQSKSIQIFSCWEGDQNKPPNSLSEITFSDLQNDKFIFGENELININGVA